ncbi:HIT-like protein [Trametes maxima]|nr:HIT-like protein [Trametes maxima]
MFLKICCSKSGIRNIDKPEQESLLETQAESPHLNCIFCGASKETGFNVVWENEYYTVFTDINPSSQHHLQLVPKKHIGSVKSLDSSDAETVREMIEIGHEVLDSLNVPPRLRRLGFHIPPYISVPHLHMHLQALPYRSFLRRLKYPVMNGSKGREKGLSWFVEAEQAVRLLEKGVHIRILPC